VPVGALPHFWRNFGASIAGSWDKYNYSDQLIASRLFGARRPRPPRECRPTARRLRLPSRLCSGPAVCCAIRRTHRSSTCMAVNAPWLRTRHRALLSRRPPPLRNAPCGRKLTPSATTPAIDI
jgi:hypothetical protein